MTAFAVGHVEGGTNAGWKPPLKERPRDWTCERGHENRGYAANCLTNGCGAKRPA